MTTDVPSAAVAEAEADDAALPVDPAGPVPTAGAPPKGSPWLHSNALIVLVIGVVVTVALSLGARSIHDSNEDRLLRQRAREIAAVVGASIPSVQAPLTAAAILAETTNGQVAPFERLMRPIVSASRPFISASLWSRRGNVLRPLVVVGKRPELATETPAAVQGLFTRAEHSKSFVINNLLTAPERRLGYVLTASPTARYVVDGETALPSGRRAAIDKNSAFADFGYALFVGSAADPSQLLASSTGGAKLQGRTASVTAAFGDTQLLIVLAPHKELGGTLLARLPLILALLGLLFTAAAVWLVERLTRRRGHAERLANENARLFADQRSVAQSLQHSLLPDVLPEVPGLDVGARYIAGVRDIDIGGDWYDIMPLKNGLTLVVVGDVSGRGLEAASIMATLRIAIRAYAVQGDTPATILSRLGELVSIRAQGHFATVLCGMLDASGRQVTFANAGHPRPLRIGDADPQYLETPVGVPVGVDEHPRYDEASFVLAPRSIMLMYTDGLIERHGENIDIGLERLKVAAKATHGSLAQVLDALVAENIPDDSDDDTALLGVRWQH